ncbi:PREDICTED: protein ABIL4-like [Camelina sativa]|uniref:Protein ABIL4-like n=1 Tax=Camelina sativa TaxID=90675 RepID=A0ABM1QP13_CAMSA|nr:PREDICTED: protein ABIL4-like [Camelina sativa]XP_019088502.1 PREDICTED: protein ABIL4-like [Camelina sativa]
MRLCREYMGKSGTHQHLLLFQYPRHHKRYFFPQQGRGTSFSAGDDSCRFKSGVRSTILENPPNTARKANKAGSFSFAPIIVHNNINSRTPSKRTNSPMRFPLLRSGSLLKRSSSPSQPKKPPLPEPQRAIPVSRNTEIVEIKQSSSRKGKKILMLKALMSMSKSRN